MCIMICGTYQVFFRFYLRKQGILITDSLVRLDQTILDLHLAETLPKAQALIMAGAVLVNDTPQTKAGFKVPSGATVRLKAAAAADHGWVSRGALKLLRGIEAFSPMVQGAVCLDIGASTGGFTEVLLSKGARRVYAVDVGYGQLDWKLRSDARVVVLEKTNARNLDAALIPEPIDGLVCDASFISLTAVLPVPMGFVKPGGWLLTLIKPQFEADYADITKGGIVRDAAVQQEVVDRISVWIGEQPGWTLDGVVDSPITGQDGNREFLLFAHKNNV